MGIGISTNYRQSTDQDESEIRVMLEEAGLHTESLGTGRTRFFVAEQDGNMVGVAGFEFYGNDALLRSVAIRSDKRTAGIGSAFIDWMVSRADEDRIKRIILLTESAKAFFEKKGFAVIDRSLINNALMTSSSEFVSVCSSSAATMMLTLR